MIQPDGIHVIPVPDGMSAEQAWECITRGVALAARTDTGWVNVEIKDGRMVRVIPPAEVDLLAELNELYRRIGACKQHPRVADPAYERVWLGLCGAADGIHDALDGWPA